MSSKLTTTTSVDLLILGAGWTSTFLIPLLQSQNISYAATSRHHIPDDKHLVFFEFDQNSTDPAPFNSLPPATTVLITFPITVPGASERLVRFYEETHEGAKGKTGFVQLGSTGIWDETVKVANSVWSDRHSPINTSNARAAAEAELLALSPSSPTTVLNLCGLWGGERSIKHWVGKVLPTKYAVRKKTSVHMMHGEDVSRAILAVHKHFDRAVGERWLLSDLRVYDWWDLASAWGETKSREKHPEEDRSGDGIGPQPRWVRELMQEEGVRALPRDIVVLGRALDSREFWTTFELEPIRCRLEEHW
ncbi:hypothetical protein BXZ70DRAFT_963792 [Cristinia sonorae]|uniref:Uncharacterized protein n=1 Tax=Cristinia sonorae TaxID=1940300 RepID=A0A8K0XK29_9AGAR|nr:hypothetical protein BXZ70DRAFT_963792 [Cristinia sonorae]